MDNRGYWYNRRTKQYLPIIDHAQAAIDEPERYKLSVTHRLLSPTTDRERLITVVASHGFIRIRHTTGFLAWQFYANPPEALQTLRGYIRKHEVGPITEVVFSELSQRPAYHVFGLVSDFLRRKPPATLQTLLDQWDTRDIQLDR